MGWKSPVRLWESKERSVYKIIRSDRVSTRRGRAPTEGWSRFGRPAVGRKPADALRKYRPDLSPPIASSPRPARLRTGTSGHRRAALVRSRFQRTVQVNDELAQGQFTLLSGEICMAFRGRFGGAGCCSSGESGMPDNPERNRGSESGRCRSQQTS